MIFNLMKPVPTTESATIPEGGTYYVGVTSTTLGDYTGATATYTAGDSFPATVSSGDVYVYGDYEYRYNRFYLPYVEENILLKSHWNESEWQNGWGVQVLDKSKSSYGEILRSINEANITNVCCTFFSCASLIKAPSIPNTVLRMGAVNSTQYIGTFFGCTMLTDLSALVVPPSVEWMDSAFEGCVSLSGSIRIDATPSSYPNCLKGTRITEILGDCGNKYEILATAGITMYSYNGTVLPALPEWDKETYPYAVMVQYVSLMTPTPGVTAYLIASSKPLSFSGSGAGFRGYANDICSTIAYVCSDKQALEGEAYYRTWAGYVSYSKENIPSGDEIVSLIGSFATTEFIWSDYDVYHTDGTMLCEASDPVPIYE